MSFAGHSPFFLALAFIIVTRKAETLTGMCHCGLCVCVHVCDRVHRPMWKKPVPVFAECRQTDEGKTERHISFIGSLGVLLFCFGGLAVIHHDLTCTAICQP